MLCQYQHYKMWSWKYGLSNSIDFTAISLDTYLWRNWKKSPSLCSQQPLCQITKPLHIVETASQTFCFSFYYLCCFHHAAVPLSSQSRQPIPGQRTFSGQCMFLGLTRAGPVAAGFLKAHTIHPAPSRWGPGRKHHFRVDLGHWNKLSKNSSGQEMPLKVTQNRGFNFNSFFAEV